MEKIKIQDESGDRRYFTIIPNYILNHSTAKAQALYLQLKRLAGEDGLAYPSQGWLMKQLGITKPTLIKEFKYLVDKGWIQEAGYETIETNGGNQQTKSYKIVDLWDLNTDHYRSKGVKNRPNLESKGVKNSIKGGKENIAKGVKNRPTKKNPYEEEPLRTYMFETFWNIYPKKSDKKKSELKWNRLNEKTRILILEDIPKRIKGQKWMAGFVENPTTYLNGERWNDEIEIVQDNKPEIFELKK